jgi:hypothetical protein
MDEALIIRANGRTQHVYLHQAVDNDGGRWATSGKRNSNYGWSLYGDGRVVSERYDAQTNERIGSKVVAGATWRALVAA